MLAKKQTKNQFAVGFYQECKKLSLPYYLKDQLLRAPSSVVLNMSEGSAKFSHKDKLRFYGIAMASHREVQAILEIEEIIDLQNQSAHLGDSLYRLVTQ